MSQEYIYKKRGNLVHSLLKDCLAKVASHLEPDTFSLMISQQMTHQSFSLNVLHIKLIWYSWQVLLSL